MCPELPEVETVRRGLGIVGKTIKHVERSKFKLRYELEDSEALIGAKVTKLDRRAKYLLLSLTVRPETRLVIHLGMTGSLREGSDVLKHDHFRFVFSDESSLIYRDARRFGGIFWADDRLLSRLYNIPEVFDAEFTAEYLKTKLEVKSRVVIKTALLDQEIVGGIGNIYACEALYAARISPLRLAATLALSELQSIVYYAKSIMHQSVSMAGTTIRDFVGFHQEKGNFAAQLKVYGKDRCQGCDSDLQRRVIGGRSTFFCKNCQI